jgi:hypothetical protein
MFCPGWLRIFTLLIRKPGISTSRLEAGTIVGWSDAPAWRPLWHMCRRLECLPGTAHSFYTAAMRLSCCCARIMPGKPQPGCQHCSQCTPRSLRTFARFLKLLLKRKRLVLIEHLLLAGAFVVPVAAGGVVGGGSPADCTDCWICAWTRTAGALPVAAAARPRNGQWTGR